jgi:tetratricopeptide (TPR) repeat protein
VVAYYYYQHHNDFPTALSFLQTALSLASSTGNIKRESRLLRTLADIKHRIGEYSAGQIHAYEARRLANISADLCNEAGALRIEALCWQTLGHYRHALLLCDRARCLLVLCGLSGGELDLVVMNTQAKVHKSKSEYVEAHNIQLQILNGLNIEQGPRSHAFALLNIAEIDVPIGATKDEVQANIDVAKSIFNRADYALGLIMCDIILADIALRDGNMSAAKTLLLKSLNSSWVDPEICEYCLERLGEGNRWSATYWRPSWATIFLVNSLKLKQKREIYQALRFVGDVFRAEGDQDTAVSLFTVALEGFTHMDIHRNRADSLLRLGDISNENGDVMKAVEFWKTARPLFERSSQAKQVSLLDDKLSRISQDMLDDYERSLTLLSNTHALTMALNEFDIRTTEENSVEIYEKVNLVLGGGERQPVPPAL